MTDTHPSGYDIASAVEFNRSKAKDLGWLGNIPALAIRNFPDLAINPVRSSYPKKVAFAEAVLAAQQKLFTQRHKWDGKLGGQTFAALVKAYNFVQDGARYHLHHGVRKVAKKDRKYHLITYEEPGGYDLHRSGHKPRGGKPILRIFWHWSATHDVHSCFHTLRNAGKSSHYGVGVDTVYQWLDTGRLAYHAAGGNHYSIGIDLCATPVRSHLDDYIEEGYAVERVKNTTGRGDREVLTMDPRMVYNAQMLVLDLCEIHDVPLQTFLTSKGEFDHSVQPKSTWGKDGFRGVVGHHHLNPKKWDIACWMEQLMGPLLRGEVT